MSEIHPQLPGNGVLPWTKSCFVCGESNPHGLRLKCRLEDGVPTIRYTPSARDLGWKERVHGGITITLLDEVMTWAAMLAARMGCVAAEVNSRLRKPLSAGQEITVRGKATTVRARLVCTEATMEISDGIVVATATGKYMAMDGGELATSADDLIEGPGTIPCSLIFR